MAHRLTSLMYQRSYATSTYHIRYVLIFFSDAYIGFRKWVYAGHRVCKSMKRLFSGMVEHVTNLFLNRFVC